MAHLIEVNGSERRIEPPQEDGFGWADFAAVLGPDLLLVPFNEYAVMVLADLPEQCTSGRNDKATHIAQMVLGDSVYQVYGNALFVTGEELTPFLREAGVPDEELRSRPRKCRSTVLRRGNLLRRKVSAYC